jgi:hypothetical protein
MADDAELIIAELVLARERVVSPSIAEKQVRRDAYRLMISRIQLWQETGRDKPTAAELRDLLGPETGGTIPLVLQPALAQWDETPQ